MTITTKILKEHIRGVLAEVGEGTDPYPFEFRGEGKVRGNTGRPMGGYKIKGEVEYMVSITPLGGEGVFDRTGIRVDFYSVRRDGEGAGELEAGLTGMGLKVMFRLMTTIKLIIKDYLGRYNWKVNYIGYAAGGEKRGGDISLKKAGQRNKLYLSYIKRLFPGGRVQSTGTNKDVVTYVHFNKKVKDTDI